MSLGIIDVVIVLFILLGAVIGFKDGVIKKTTGFIGVFLVLILGFMFKNQLSVLLYESLPFFSFGGFIKGVDVLNILLYELIAFLAVATILTFILRVLLVITGLIEKLLKATLFLSLPSKILGIIVGALEAYTYIFIALFVLSQPIFNLKIITESNYANIILDNTPIISGYAKETLDTYKDVYTVLDNRKEKKSEEVNEEILTILLDKKIVSIESATKLIEGNKISVVNPNFIDKYK